MSATELVGKGVKRISCFDLLTLEPFQGWSAFDIISPKHESDVFAFLYALGADTNRVVHVQACRHRTLTQGVKLGYSFVAHERTDKEWLSTQYASMQARFESVRDDHLRGDMLNMYRQGVSFSKFRDMCAKAGGQDGTTNDIKKTPDLDTCASDQALMKILQEEQIRIRGPLNEMEEDLFTHLN